MCAPRRSVKRGGDRRLCLSPPLRHCDIAVKVIILGPRGYPESYASEAGLKHACSFVNVGLRSLALEKRPDLCTEVCWRRCGWRTTRQTCTFGHLANRFIGVFLGCGNAYDKGELSLSQVFEELESNNTASTEDGEVQMP